MYTNTKNILLFIIFSFLAFANPPAVSASDPLADLFLQMAETTTPPSPTSAVIIEKPPFVDSFVDHSIVPSTTHSSPSEIPAFASPTESSVNSFVDSQEEIRLTNIPLQPEIIYYQENKEGALLEENLHQTAPILSSSGPTMGVVFSFFLFLAILLVLPFFGKNYRKK
jgi:hypothetical protein